MNKFSQIRAQLGITQSAMADALGMSQGNISNYENGQTIPPAVADKLIKYAATYGVELTYDLIYGQVGTRSPPTADPRQAPDRPRRNPPSPEKMLTLRPPE
jgi:putative transcriptional regulator